MRAATQVKGITEMGVMEVTVETRDGDRVR
jgi:hypothetical protein